MFDTSDSDSGPELDLIIGALKEYQKELLKIHKKPRKKRKQQQNCETNHKRSRIEDDSNHRKGLNRDDLTLTKSSKLSDFKKIEADDHTFTQTYRMPVKIFHTLLGIFKKELQPIKKKRPGRAEYDQIPAKLKFAAAIEYLASGTIPLNAAKFYGINPHHVFLVADKVCDIICKKLEAEISQLDESKLKKNAEDFNSIWNIPNCVGAINGLHLGIRTPTKNSSEFGLSEEGFNSLLLLSIVDATYKFSKISLESSRLQNSNWFNKTNFGQEILSEKFPYPPDTNVDEVWLPYFFASNVSLNHKRVMTPYVIKDPSQLLNEEQKSFNNYYLNSSNRCGEIAFKLLSKKWRVLHQKLDVSQQKASRIATACCLLHNYLLRTTKDTYCPNDFVDNNDWADGMLINGEQYVPKPGDILSLLPLGIGEQSCDESELLKNKLMEFLRVQQQQKKSGINLK